MDEKEYLSFLDTCIGHRMNFDVTTVLEPNEGKKLWKGLGSVLFSVTRDGKNWGEVKMKSMTYDVNPTNAIATIIGSAMNYANSDDYLEDLFKALLKAESEGNENAEELTEVTEG